MRSSAERGDIRGALRQFERMDQALRRELGTVPSAEARELRAQLEKGSGNGSAPQSRRLFGRRDVGNLIGERLDQAASGRGGTLLFAGPPGVGKSAVLELAERMATRRGWRTGRGTASAVEGPWPYAPVLEALNDLCRKHHALLDGLDDVYRLEIERALSGREVSWTGESSHQRLFVAAAELIRLAAAGHGLLLVVDDVHEADDASLRLLHYLSRCAVTEPVLIVLAHRPVHDQPLREVADSLVSRGTGVRVELDPLSEGATRRLLADRFPDLPAETVERIWAVSGGLPFAALELARDPGAGAHAVLPALPVAGPDHLPAIGPARRDVHHRRVAGGVGRRRGRGLPAARGRGHGECSSSGPSPGTASGTLSSATRWSRASRPESSRPRCVRSPRRWRRRMPRRGGSLGSSSPPVSRPGRCPTS